MIATQNSGGISHLMSLEHSGSLFYSATQSPEMLKSCYKLSVIGSGKG
jgi:hypothetical protein